MDKFEILSFLNDLMMSELSGGGYGLNCDYSDRIIIMEDFSRKLYGLIPLVINKFGDTDKYVEYIRESIVKGTDPNSEAYWGNYTCPDQRVCESIPVALVLVICKKEIWDMISRDEKSKITKWLNLVNTGTIYDSNWLFFRIIVNACLKALDEAYNQSVMNDALNRVDRLYLGDGWYQDGRQRRIDYYNAFAFHFYSLIYASLFPADKHSERFIERAKLFANDFILLCSSHGDMVPYGRSLTYKMAEGCFWSIQVFTGIYCQVPEVVKGIIGRHFEFWKNQPILKDKTKIDVGYTYFNPFITENYNNWASSNWALKFFLFAANTDTKFWSLAEKHLPKLPNSKLLEKCNMAVCSDENRQIVTLFPNNFCSGREIVLNFAHKYMKFMYSTCFGFSVPRSNDTYERGGYDNILAVSEDGIHYCCREEMLDCVSTAEYLYSKYKPIPNVVIESYIIPDYPWHIRIHIIHTKSSIWLKDAGSAINCESVIKEDKTGSELYLCSKENIVGAKSYSRNVNIKKIVNTSNTNLIYPRCCMPVCECRVEEGDSIVCNAFYNGTVSNNNIVPSCEIVDHTINIRINDRDIALRYGVRMPSITAGKIIVRKSLISLKKLIKRR